MCDHYIRRYIYTHLYTVWCYNYYLLNRTADQLKAAFIEAHVQEYNDKSNM